MKWVAKAELIAGMDGKISSPYPLALQTMTALRAATIIQMVCSVSGSYPIMRISNNGTKMPPSPYTANTTKANTESPKPGNCCPTSAMAVTNTAMNIVTSLVVVCSVAHSGFTSSVMAAVQANT